MGEALIGRSSSMSNEIIENIVADYIISQQPGSSIFTQNGTFIAKKSGDYSIIMIGGGGGSGGGANYSENSYSANMVGGGGGSGYLTMQSVYLNKNESINIVIGSGGRCGSNSYGNNKNVIGGDGNSGGTTFFGNYLSANGGGGGKGGQVVKRVSTNMVSTLPSNGAAGKGYHNGNGTIGGNGIIPPDIFDSVDDFGAGGNYHNNGHDGCLWIGWN